MTDHFLDAERPPFRRNLRESVRLATIAARLAAGTSRWMMAVVVALSVVAAILPTLQLILTKAVIDRVSLDLGLDMPGAGLAERAPVGAWIGLAVAGLIVAQLIAPVSRTMESLIADRLTGRLVGRLLGTTNRWRGIARFEDPAFADDLRIARDRTARIGMDLITVLTECLAGFVTAASLVVVLASFHPVAPVVIVLAALPMITRRWDFGLRTGYLLYWKTPGARQLEYLRNAAMDSAFATDIRLYGLPSFLARRYDDVLAKVQGRVDRERLTLLPGMTLSALLASAAAAAIWVWVVVAIADGQATLGDLALVGTAAILLQSRLETIGELFGRLPAYMQHLPSLGRILDAGPDLPVPDHPQPVPHPLREGVRFDRVTFTYPGQTNPTLRQVSFTIPAGGSLALVGLNGSGKTTIVKLLLRLYDPDAGAITLDGTDTRAVAPDDLRRAVTVTFQDFVRYDLTAGENIAVGDLSARDDPDRLIAAARLSGADAVIDRLPDGLDTVLGRELGDHDLSAGQWQRIALARAFVRRDAQLLILDEPTAALDMQTEYEVYRRFAELTRDRTTLLISHRLSAVRLADRILFLEDGAIVESGSHDELMTRDGRYARLYRTQAAHYGIDPNATYTDTRASAATTDDGGFQA